MAFTGVVGSVISQGAHVVPGSAASSGGGGGIVFGTFTSKLGAPLSRLGNIALGFGIPGVAPPPPLAGFTGQLGIPLSALGNIVLGFGQPAPVVQPTWFYGEDLTATRVRLKANAFARARRRKSIASVEALNMAPPPPPTPLPLDPSQVHAQVGRRRLCKRARRKAIQALIEQHGFGVDVIDPFLVVRTVRSMLAAGTWEPGGY